MDPMPRDTSSSRQKLKELDRALANSLLAQCTGIDSQLEDDTLTISIKGQAIGAWQADGAASDLTLYRPGSSQIDSRATTTAEAAAMTARLVASAGQA